MDTVVAISELRTLIEPMLERYGIKSAFIFGSYARGEATPASDIDILVEGDDSFRPLRMYALSEEIREKLNKDVDIFEVSELDESPFKNHVLKEAIQL